MSSQAITSEKKKTDLKVSPLSQNIQRIIHKPHDSPHHDCHHGHCDHSHFHQENHQLKALIGLIWGFGQFLLPISMPLLNILNAALTIYLGLTVYQSAWKALHERKIVMTTLYTISTLSILFVSVFSFFIPWLPMMSEAAPLILGFWHLGEFIENNLVKKINQKLNVMDCLSSYATLKGEPEQIISIDAIKPKDTLLINNGEFIPVDGHLIQPATLNTTRIDGSPLVKTFQKGAILKSGMRVVGDLSFAEMVATHTYQDSYLSKVAKNIENAHLEKAPIELLANKILYYFIPGLVSIAVSSGIIIASMFGPVAALQCVISVLVSACPCALSLITPMAVKIGMQKASEKGIHFKNGKDLQAAAQITDVVFDLNGTLTQGEIKVTELNINDNKILPLIAKLESHSKHPVAQSIHRHILQKIPESTETIEIMDIIPHHSGIQANINGKHYLIGNLDYLNENDISLNDYPQTSATHFIVENKRIIGHVILQDTLRDDAIDTVKTLQQLGKTVHICTGATASDAKKYADLLNIKHDHIYSNAGLEHHHQEGSKASYIKKLQDEHRKVAMVGDALNDVEAIVKANIGIAVQSIIGDKITQENASITVPKDTLFSITSALDVAQKTSNNIHQNLMLSLTYNSIITMVASGVLLAWGIGLNPIMGTALMILESVIIFCNLLRFKRQDIISRSNNHDTDEFDEKKCCMNH